MESRHDARKHWAHTMHGARWRSCLANDEALRGLPRVPQDFDDITRQAVGYYPLIAQGENGEQKAKQAYPEIALAEAAWDHPALRSAIQVLVIANVAVAEICEKLDLSPAVLNIVEALFFDVRPVVADR